MKVHQTFTLDLEIVEKLKKEANASLLINNMLNKHYNSTKYEDMSLEQLQQLKEKMLKIKELERQKEVLVKNG